MESTSKPNRFRWLVSGSVTHSLQSLQWKIGYLQKSRYWFLNTLSWETRCYHFWYCWWRKSWWNFKNKTCNLKWYAQDQLVQDFVHQPYWMLWVESRSFVQRPAWLSFCGYTFENEFPETSFDMFFLFQGLLWGSLKHTLPKTNIAPENQWLEDVFPTEIVPFLGDMLVLGRVTWLSELFVHQIKDVDFHKWDLISSAMNAHLCNTWY